jgi:hypothetical protein
LRAKSSEVPVRRRTARGFPGRPAVPGDECPPPRIAGVSQPSGQPQATHGHGRSGPYQGVVAAEPWQLRPPQDDRRAEGGWRRSGAPACRARSSGKQSLRLFSEPPHCARTGLSLKERGNSKRRRTLTTHSTLRLTCWTVTSRPIGPTRNGQGTSVTSGPVRAGCIWP